MKDLFRVTKVDHQLHRIYYINDLTKKGEFESAENIYNSDTFECFDNDSKRTISFYAGVEYQSQRNFISKKSKIDFGSNYLYAVFIAVYAIIYFASNLTGSTLIYLGSIGNVYTFIVPAAIFIYSFTFIIDAIITEVYNISVARRIYTIVAFSSLVIMAIIYGLSYLPAYGTNYLRYFFSDENNVFRIFIASLLSFILSQYINTTIISRIKYKKYKKYGIQHGGSRKKIITRFIIASMITTLVDSIIFCFIAFAFKYPILIIIQIVIAQYVVKVSFDILFSFVSSKIAIRIKKIESTDIVEKMPISYKNIIGLKLTSKDCHNIYNSN